MGIQDEVIKLLSLKFIEKLGKIILLCRDQQEQDQRLLTNPSVYLGSKFQQKKKKKVIEESSLVALSSQVFCWLVLCPCDTSW